ncbi:MAG: AraC family transcriptional regulator [Marinobacter sp.]|nr:AraC family transcriptional regulator [Marinobacter sp.]
MNALLSGGTLPVIRAHYAEILCQLAEERGVAQQELVSAAGIRQPQLSHPDNFITLDQFTELCRQAFVRCKDDSLGLEFGRRLKFTAHGALSQAAISCDTRGRNAADGGVHIGDRASGPDAGIGSRWPPA